MNQIQNQLVSLGLSATEATIYTTGLRYPSLGVAELQKLTNIKRPTVYHALGSLVQKGLVAKSGSETRLQFTFAPPERLLRLVEAQMSSLSQKSDIIKDLLPLLKQDPSSDDQTLVSHYEGAEGVRTVVDIALYCRKPEWDILAPVVNFFSEFDEEFARYFMATRSRRGIRTRSLWESKKGRDLSRTEMAERQPRYLPKLMQGRFKSVIIVFDDKVAIISSAEKLSAILITSVEINALIEAMFEGLWSVSEEPSNKPL